MLFCILEKSTRAVLRPGSRGSFKWWVDKQGNTRYGERPKGKSYRIADKSNRSVREHLRFLATRRGQTGKYTRDTREKVVLPDRQQQLVYAAEDFTLKYSPDITKVEAERILKGTLPYPVRLNIIKTKEADLMGYSHPSFVDRKNFPRGQYRRTTWAVRGVVDLHITKGRNKMVLLHEIAHMLQPRSRAEFHGPDFCATYLALVRRYAGVSLHNRLKDSFDQHRVNYHGKVKNPFFIDRFGKHINKCLS